MNAPLRIPPSSSEDRLPHDRAVWRDGAFTGPPGISISVDYGGGLIKHVFAHMDVDWGRVKRWRFGWAPAS